MSDNKAEIEQSPKADADQPREPQPTSSPQQASSSPQPSSPASTSRAVTFKTPSQPTEDSSSRRKREREGSLEPAQLTPSRATEAIPAKKNRLEDSLQEEDDETAGHSAETEKVGHIRKKVDELSTKELQSANDTTPSDSAAATQQERPAATAPETAATSDTVKKDSASAEKSAAETQDSKPAQDAPARTQPTFSSFSSKSSPFGSVPSSSGSSAGASKSGFSAFAAKSSSPLVGSGIKPSSLGSSIGGHNAENGSASPSGAASTSAAAPSKPIVKGSSFGFGAFAGASPLAKPKAQSPAASEKPSDKPESSDDKATFEQKLLSEDHDASAASETKTKPLLEATEAESKLSLLLIFSSSIASSVLILRNLIDSRALQPKPARKTRRAFTASAPNSTQWPKTSRGKNEALALFASTSPKSLRTNAPPVSS